MSNAEPQQTDVSEQGASITHLFAADHARTRVRGATFYDVPWIVAELREFAKFYGTKRSLFPESEEGASELIRRIIANHLFFVAESPNGVPYGFISGFVVPHVFNPEIKVLSEAFWWVKPQYRGGRAGALLFKAFVEWGHANAHWVTMTLEAHSPVQPASLIKRGFRLQEQTFLLEVEK